MSKKPEQKVDKRSKAYRDSIKLLKKDMGKVVVIKKQQQLGYSSLALKKLQENIEKYADPISIQKTKTHYEMIIELQDWCRALDERNKELNEKICNLETKVG